MPVQRLTISIDARAASHPQPGGFKSYVKNLIHGLSAVDSHNNYLVYLDRRTSNGTLALGDNFQLRIVNNRLPAVSAIWREQLQLPAQALLRRPDVAHFPTGTAPTWHLGAGVVTIHDAIEHMPRETTGAEWPRRDVKRQLMLSYNRYTQRLAAKRATLVLTVSQCSRSDIASYLRVPPEKIRVIPGAPAPLFRPLLPATVDEDVTRLGPFILAIGSPDPRKNISTLIRAYAALPVDLIEHYHLVLVWTHHLLQDRLLQLAEQLGIGDRVVSKAAQSDEELCQLYNAATVFVFPSLYEGFGLPPLEAMACGTPVIASHSSSLPEVLGDAAFFFDPGSVTQLAELLSRVLSDSQLRRRLSSQGIAHASQYSWGRTSKLTLSAYEEAASLATPTAATVTVGKP